MSSVSADKSYRCSIRPPTIPPSPLSTGDPGSGAPSTGSATWNSVGLDNFATTANMAGFRFASSNSQQVTFDELRLGDSFNAVIPEPSTFALVGLTGLALVFGLRRRY